MSAKDVNRMNFPPQTLMWGGRTINILQVMDFTLYQQKNECMHYFSLHMIDTNNIVIYDALIVT